MKDILLWDSRFPNRDPRRLSVDDALASALVRAGVAAPLNQADFASLNLGGSLDPSNPTEIVVEETFAKRMRRIVVPVSVAVIAVSLGLGAGVGGAVTLTPPPAPSPTLSLSSAVIFPEGNSGTTAHVWTLTLNRDGSTASYPYSWAVTGSGANPADGADFGGTYPSGSGAFAPGETSKTITVLVTGDTAVEPDETFTLTVTGTGLNTVTSIGTISNDDVSGPTIITPGTTWAAASAAAIASPTLATYGAGTGFTTPPTESATPVGSAIYPAYGYQINAATTWGEYCWYVDDDNFVGVIWGSVGADQINGRLDYVDFYLEGDTPTRLTQIQWDSATGTFGVRVNLRAPANKNGVARWYARCVPVNGMERLLTGTVWFNSRPDQDGYIDRAARSVWVNPDIGVNEYTTANRGSAAAPYRTIEYALTCMLPSGNAPGQTPTPRTETKEGGFVYLVGDTHMLDGTNYSGDPSFMNGTGTITLSAYSVRNNAPSATVLPVRVTPAPGSSTTPWITRSIRQVSSNNSTVSQGTSCRFVGSVALDGSSNPILTVSRVLNGALHPGTILYGGGMSGSLIYRQITSTESGGAQGGRGTYLVSYASAVPSQLLSAGSAIALKHNRLVFDGVNIDSGKIIDLGTGSTYASLYFKNGQIWNRDATVIGPVDANGYPVIYRAQGSIGNAFISLSSITREACAFNTQFKAQCFTGWSKVVNCAGQYAWDAVFDTRDQTSRPDLAIFNYRAIKPVAWKSRLHDADTLTVASATYDLVDTTIIRFQVGPGYLNAGDSNGSDVGIMAVTGTQAGVIDTWASANSSSTADNDAVGFTFNTVAGDTTLTVTSTPTAGKIQTGMYITAVGGYFAAETHILDQVSTSEGDGSWGGKGVYTLTKGAAAAVTGGTGAKVSNGLCLARVKGNLSALQAGDKVRMYATGHGDAQQSNTSPSAVNIQRSNWVFQNMAVTGVDLQPMLTQQGSVSGTGTITAAAGSTTATLSTAQNLYAGQCIRVSPSQQAFVKTTSSGTSVVLTAPFTGGAVSAAAFTIGKTLNGVSHVNTAIIKRRVDTTDNWPYAIGDNNDNLGQIQQGVRNYSYLCSTLICQNKQGAFGIYFRASMAGFGVEAMRMDGCVLDGISSDGPFPTGFSGDGNNFRIPAATLPIPASSANSSNDPTPVSEITWALGTGYAGKTVTAALAAAAPFDLDGNRRRPGDPIGAIARLTT